MRGSPFWSRVGTHHDPGQVPPTGEFNKATGPAGTLTRIALNLGEHLGYRVVDRALNLNRVPLHASKWIVSARILAEFPGTQVVGIQAREGAPLQAVVRSCTKAFKPNLTIIIPARTTSCWVAIQGKRGPYCAVLDFSDGSAWDPAFTEAFRWSTDYGSLRPVRTILASAEIFLSRTSQYLLDTRPSRDEILTPEEYLKWFVLPLKDDPDGTIDLLTEMIAVPVTTELSPTSKNVAQAQRRTETRNEIVRRNLRLACWCADQRRKGRRSLTYSDLVQEAAGGLMRAAERFDPTRGAQYGTYATIWARQHLSRAITDCDEFIRLPAYIKPDQRRSMQAQFNVVSLNRLAKSTRLTLQSRQECLDPIRASAIQELRDHISDGLKWLDDRQGLILAHRFGLCGRAEMTLDELGVVLNVTRERVRQIEAKALGRITFFMGKRWNDGQPI